MKLGLGTAQIGLDYGISNSHGKTSLTEAKNILDVAVNAQIDVLDTAFLYGNSEAVLGEILNEREFHVVTKTPQFRVTKISKAHALELKTVFTSSLKKLNSNSVYGLLVHHADDLLAVNGEYLMEALIDIKQRKLTKKIGVSVYSGEQIEQLLDRYQIDLIQLPMNVLDQRVLARCVLENLKHSGVEIHVRSIFLQGLLLMNPEQLSSYFEPIKPTLKKYHAILKDFNLTALQGSLAFMHSIPEVDYSIVGVTSSQELNQISSALNSLPSTLPDWSEFASDDLSMINPSYWPKS